jgi:hypothetical protein
MAGCILVRNCRKWSLFAGTAVFTPVFSPFSLLHWLKVVGAIKNSTVTDGTLKTASYQ